MKPVGQKQDESGSAGRKGSGLLDYFQGIVELTEKHGLTEEFFREAAFPLNMVSIIMQITPLQAALFSLLLERAGERAVETSEIAKALNCGSIQLLKYLDEFEALEQMKLIRAIQTRENRFPKDRLPSRLSLPSYIIPLDVIKAVRQGVAYKSSSYNNLGNEDFFEVIGDLLSALRENEISYNGFNAELKSIFDENEKLQIVKNLQNLDLGDEGMLIFLYFCCVLVEGAAERISLVGLCRYIGLTSVRLLKRSFAGREHKLITLGLIENSHDKGLADTERYSLTDKAKDTFLADVSFKKKNRQKDKDFIISKTIKSKELFYSEKIKGRIEELTNLLRKENFKMVKNRLSKQNMRTGFTCLFSGPPGTGKTETVYQIARKTGRDIFLVDISDTKSMWFGESEKKIKSLFDKYKDIIKQNERNSMGPEPILLFNEADGVMGKRQELGENRRGPSQTENSIQNIILQEMEDLSGGILIATTNMSSNFDKAFERRFLYKIEFEKPDEEIKAAIWRSIMPHISEDDALSLARRFDFSGGQIENIARKEAVSSILGGKQHELEEIIALCDEELIDKKKARIGFASG